MRIPIQATTGMSLSKAQRSCEVLLCFSGNSAKWFRDLPLPEQELPRHFGSSAVYAEMLPRAYALQATASADVIFD